MWGVFLFYFCIFLKSSIESGKIECQIGNVMFLVEIKCTKSAQGCAMFADIVYSLCSFIIEGSHRKGFLVVPTVRVGGQRSDGRYLKQKFFF